MSTFTQLHFHIVFSTKYRNPTLQDSWRNRLWEYMGGIARQHKGQAKLINGTRDHVHSLISISPTIAISDFVKNYKAASSKWVHEEIQDRDVWWQDGYSAFSVSHSGIDQVLAYIRDQETHHQTRSFQEELLILLKKHDVPFDERYVFD